MNTGFLLRRIHQVINSVTSMTVKLSVETVQNIVSRRICYIHNRQILTQAIINNDTSALLQPLLPMYYLIRGLKAKGRLQLRCKDCYFMCKEDRWFVMCKTHPRHKQVKQAKKEHKTWILTFASQSKVRDW